MEWPLLIQAGHLGENCLVPNTPLSLNCWFDGLEIEDDEKESQADSLLPSELRDKEIHGMGGKLDMLFFRAGKWVLVLLLMDDLEEAIC